MFRALLGIYSDPLQMRELFKEVESVLQGICEPVRIGASYICSPSSISLVTILLVEKEVRPMALVFKIESESAQELAKLAGEIYQRLKSRGVHATLLNSDNTFR